MPIGRAAAEHGTAGASKSAKDPSRFAIHLLRRYALGHSKKLLARRCTLAAPSIGDVVKDPSHFEERNSRHRIGRDIFRSHEKAVCTMMIIHPCHGTYTLLLLTL